MFEPHGGQKLRDEGERGLKAKLARLEEEAGRARRLAEEAWRGAELEEEARSAALEREAGQAG